MGQALYRKYRSKSLDEIVGQEHITETLAKAVKSGRISHAYLFTGPRGVGKTSIARILAHEINGLPYDDDQSHIDIIEIDAASNRRIDEIRELRDKIHVVPAMAKYKVYIIDEVHMLTREAFNALLKTLEEPPEHAIFILATTEAHKLPETIVSRTQRYIFRPIEASKAIEHLRSIAKREKIEVADDALALIVEHGDGSFRDSISLLDQLANSGAKIDLEAVQRVLGIAPTEAIESLLRAIRGGQPAGILFTQLSSLFDQGYQPSSVAKQLATALRKQLIADTESVTNDVALLAALVEVPLSHDPETLLEISLLSYGAVTALTTTGASPAISQQPAHAQPIARQQPTPEPTKAPAETAPEPSSPAIEDPEQAAEKDVPVRTVGSSDAVLNAEAWQAVLNQLKKQHNTLYGIVRMAQTDFTQPGMVHLAFGFAFHQKRANESKNRQVIGDTITAVTGSNFEITCTYDSEAKVAQPVLTAVAADTAPDTNPLSTISNIFGGVEMVE